ncbi:flagellar export protein FliJ [Paenibacillus contaminans]|uniref:Flagellar FliJ protein n=1 Tax=Paenibacillus contaminans TaxID=450362 RepID=A0A329MYL7_9BACL|nr:flagellar export protein FliJ [Paenibacillus contaminans]RAV22707.1 flagellar export protein FliJ [Paenibacillus contaminans]
MTFKYGFQKIVDLKSNEKTQAEWFFSSAIGALRLEEQSLSMLQEEKKRLHDDMVNEAVSRTSVSELLVHQTYIQHIDRQIRRKTKDVQSAKHNVSVKQEQLVHKTIEEKIWFQARDKAKQAFTALELKKEQEELDDIAITRYKMS